MKRKIKQAIACALSAVLTLGIITVVLPQSAIVAKAADGTFKDLQEEIDNTPNGKTLVLSCNYIATATEDFILIPDEKIITIDLNGKTINRNLSVATRDGEVIRNWGTLTIKDSASGGKITGGYQGGISSCGGGISNSGTLILESGSITGNYALYQGAGIYNNSYSVFTMKGGSIDNNALAEGGGKYGGIGVFNYGIFNMIGGTISNNYIESDNHPSTLGGGVLNYKEFNMSGGTISSNEATDGGGINNNGVFNMTGGVIKNNIAFYAGSGLHDSPDAIENISGGSIVDNVKSDFFNNINYGGLTLSGTLNIDTSENAIIISGNKIVNGNECNVWVDNGSTINIKGIPSSGSKIGISLFEKTPTNNVPIAFTETYNGTDVSFFKSDNSAYIIGKSSDSAAHVAVPVTISFDANGGKGIMNDQIVPGNISTELNENNYTREKYTFKCWNTEKNGSGKEYKNMFEIKTTSDTTLYAQWSINPYTVCFDPNGGSGTMRNQKRECDDGGSLTKNTFTLEEHTFAGWNTDKNGNGEYFTDGYQGNITTEATTITLYAQWDEIPHKITPTNDGNGTATASVSEGKKGTVITVSATPNDGYKFANWEVVSGGVSLTDATSASTTFTLGTEDVEVKANFEELPPNEYSVTVNADANGSTSASVNSGIEGTEVTITATANDGYKFAGWQVVSGGVTLADASATTTTFNIIKENIVIKATFEEIIKEPQPGSSEPAEPSAQEPDPDPEIPERDWLDDLRLQLRIADELGGPRTVTYSGDFALSYDIMQYLVEHPDITLIYTVTYEGVEYTITIHGGKAIADPNIPWYGPLWLLANYGGDNVPEIIAGSGKYTVVAGDTLSAIAEKFGVTVDYLAQKNGIKNPDYIIVGQIIVY